MRRPSEPLGAVDAPDPEDLRERIVGLGERSVRKNFFSEVQRFRLYLDRIGEAIVVVAPETGEVFHRNEAGRTLAERVGPREYLLPELRALIGAGRGRGLGDEGLIWERRGPEGSHWLELRLSEAPLAMGTGLVLVARDVSERMRAAREAANLRALLADILDGLPSVIVGLDAQARVTHWNRAAAAVAGLGVGEALGACIWELLPSLAPLAKALSEALASGWSQTWTRQVLDLGHRRRLFDLALYPLPGQAAVGEAPRKGGRS